MLIADFSPEEISHFISAASLAVSSAVFSFGLSLIKLMLLYLKKKCFTETVIKHADMDPKTTLAQVFTDLCLCM